MLEVIASIRVDLKDNKQTICGFEDLSLLVEIGSSKNPPPLKHRKHAAIVTPKDALSVYRNMIIVAPVNFVTGDYLTF